MIKVHIMTYRSTPMAKQDCLPPEHPQQGRRIQSRKYTHYAYCPMCEGNSSQRKMISLETKIPLL